MRTQRGGVFVGFIAGLLVGLALALGVALYVTKVPVPFIDKVPQRTADQDAAEAERNRKWNPNEALASKVPVRPASSPASSVALAASAPPGLPPPAGADAGGAASLPPVATVPAGQRPASAPSGTAVAAARTPGGAETSARPGGEPFVYFVQIGAYGRTEDAEQQRARLAMAGMTAKVTEREQSGRTVYRVRLGPYEVRDTAEAVKQQATDGGFADAVLVRVQR
jgi:cell division protein FtsN